MTNKEIDFLLSNMTIMVDTREKKWAHIENFFVENEIKYERKTLQSGDYTFSLSYNDHNYIYAKKIVVERKNSLDELAGCFGKDRHRFENEFIRLKSAGTKCFLVIENSEFDGINEHNYVSQMKPNSFEASLIAWLTRYDITPIFTSKENSGRVIYSIFKQYLRNEANGKI